MFNDFCVWRSRYCETLKINKREMRISYIWIISYLEYLIFGLSIYLGYLIHLAYLLFWTSYLLQIFPKSGVFHISKICYSAIVLWIFELTHWIHLFYHLTVSIYIKRAIWYVSLHCVMTNSQLNTDRQLYSYIYTSWFLQSIYARKLRFSGFESLFLNKLTLSELYHFFFI